PDPPLPDRALPALGDPGDPGRTGAVRPGALQGPGRHGRAGRGDPRGLRRRGPEPSGALPGARGAGTRAGARPSVVVDLPGGRIPAAGGIAGAEAGVAAEAG